MKLGSPNSISFVLISALVASCSSFLESPPAPEDHAPAPGPSIVTLVLASPSPTTSLQAGPWIGSGSIDEGDFEEASGVDVSGESTPPLASATQHANCRAGPSVAYPVLGHLPQGHSSAIVGRSSDLTWLLVQLDSGQRTCWIWALLLTTSGDLGSLPLVAPPPLPTTPPTEQPRSPTGLQGCWIIDGQHPKGVCLPRACGPNDYPGTSCSP